MNINGKYDISQYEIVFYPQSNLRVVGLVLFMILLLLFSPIFIIGFRENALLLAIGFIALVFLCCLSLYVMGGKKIIVDKRDKNICQTFGLGVRELAQFRDIDRIEHVEGSHNCYTIFLKNDPFGKGIQLTWGELTASGLRRFEAEALPRLREMIGQDTTAKSSFGQYTSDLKDLKYYNRSGNRFTVKRSGDIVWGVLLVLLSLWAFNQFWMSDASAGNVLYRVIPIIIFLGGIFFLSRRKAFDTMVGTFTISVFFFIDKTYLLSSFSGFQTVRYTNHGAYSRTGVTMTISNEKGTTYNVEIYSNRDTKKVDEFVRETRAIIDYANKK